jgi:hypothetical protein
MNSIYITLQDGLHFLNSSVLYNVKFLVDRAIIHCSYILLQKWEQKACVTSLNP